MLRLMWLDGLRAGVTDGGNALLRTLPRRPPPSLGSASVCRTEGAAHYAFSDENCGVEIHDLPAAQVVVRTQWVD